MTGWTDYRGLETPTEKGHNVGAKLFNKKNRKTYVEFDRKKSLKFFWGFFWFFLVVVGENQWIFFSK